MEIYFILIRKTFLGYRCEFGNSINGLPTITFTVPLKGVFAKNQRRKIRDFDLICYVYNGQKLLKTTLTHSEERNVHINSESCNI